jgi:predicted kinase
MITVMIGISGSGKSTEARKIAEETGAVIVSRDKVREMVFGYNEANVNEYFLRPDLVKCEKVVTQMIDTIIKRGVIAGTDMIIDNTHLSKKYLNEIIKKWQRFTSITFNIVHCDKTTAIERDTSRTRSVGAEVIAKQFESFNNFIASDFDFSDRACLISKIEKTEGLRDCVIFDIDGTLADKGTRNPFDWKAVVDDTVRENVKRSFMMHQEAGDFMIICTGRDGICSKETAWWLKKHGIIPDEFYIRTEKDQRPDWQIKEELWRQIGERFNIKLMYDDRDQVVEHARNLGLEVYQVQPGNF